MQQYDVHRSFGAWKRGAVVDLDPESAGTAALLRDGYVTPAAPPADDPFDGGPE